MKTAMQEAILYFEQQLSLQRTSKIKYTTEEALVDAIQVCKNAANTIERNQIIDAYDNGWNIGFQKRNFDSGEKYFNNTYTNQ